MTPLTDSFSCQDYVELDSIEAAFPLLDHPKDWCFQLKYDGIWAKVVIDPAGMARIYSKTGQLKHSFQVHQLPLAFNHGETVLIAEYMYGSQWSKKNNREGNLYVFDCLASGGQDHSTLPYSQRKQLADGITRELGGKFELVNNYSTLRLGDVWMHLERESTYEGIVLRKLSSTWFSKLYKLKTTIQDDFVAMALIPGEGKHQGRLGSVTMGKFRGNELVPIMDVGGGFTDAQRDYYWTHGKEIIGLTCLVEGKARFDSGALRHPCFIKVRDDKYPQECALPS